MNTKKIKKKIEKRLLKDPFMKFVKVKNPAMYKAEFNKIFNNEMKFLRQKRIGEREAERQMNFIEAQSEFNHINDDWLRKHLTYKKLQKQKKDINRNKKKSFL